MEFAQSLAVFVCQSLWAPLCIARFTGTKDEGRRTKVCTAVVRPSSFVIGLLLSSRQELYLCQALLQEAQHHGLVAVQIVLQLLQILGALLKRLDQRSIEISVENSRVDIALAADR